MIYTHVCNRPGLSICSPIDQRNFRAVLDEEFFVFKGERSPISR